MKNAPSPPTIIFLAPLMLLSFALSACASATAEYRADKAMPPALNQASLRAWKEEAFPSKDTTADLQRLARLMREDDPFLRDEIGFTGLSAILRRGDATPEALRALAGTFDESLTGEDPAGVIGPFAVLGLAELARVDRLKPYLAEEELAQLVQTCQDYLTNVSDYRGYDANSGWRHGVAHGADLTLQLVLNPRLATPQVLKLRDAIANQIRAASPYYQGEARRLARPILYMALRHSAAINDWDDWFAALAAKAAIDFESQGDALVEQLVIGHNIRLFALEIYAAAGLNEVEQLAPLHAGAEKTLRVLR